MCLTAVRPERLSDADALSRVLRKCSKLQAFLQNYGNPHVTGGACSWVMERLR